MCAIAALSNTPRRSGSYTQTSANEPVLSSPSSACPPLALPSGAVSRSPAKALLTASRAPAFALDLKASLQAGAALQVSDGAGGPAVTIQGQQYRLDDTSPWLSYAGKGEAYSVRAVLECARWFDCSYIEYLSRANSKNVPRVLLVDRPGLLEQLLGPSPSQANVDAWLRDV